MKVRNKKTRVVYEIDQEGWDKIKAKGESGKYIIESAATAVGAPAGNGADRKAIVKRAKRLEKDEDFENALEAYQEASAIKATPAITKKINELEEIIAQKDLEN